MDYSIFEEVDDLYKAGLLTEDKKKCCGCEEEEVKKKAKEEDDESGDDENEKGKVIKDDKIPVTYADLKSKPECIFKHIIVFTNDRSDENKTLKNIQDAIKAVPGKPKLHVFVAAKMEAAEDESEIEISDDTESFTINKESNFNAWLL